MPSVENFRSDEINGKEGLVIEYKYNGLSSQAVRGRATARVAAKFPLKVGELEVISVNVPEVYEDDLVNTFLLEIFVPNTSDVEEMTSENIVEAIQSLNE
jgi:hypothetical protein